MNYLFSSMVLVRRLVNRPLSGCTIFMVMLAPMLSAKVSVAAERPTFNRDTCDPRPDILPYWLTEWYTEYRRAYNRPRYWSGRVAHAIEPTSQEAMVWCEAVQMGLYDGCRQPPAYKRYFYLKPWEALNTGPRPDQKTDAAEVSSASHTTKPVGSVQAASAVFSRNAVTR